MAEGINDLKFSLLNSLSKGHDCSRSICPHSLDHLHLGEWENAREVTPPPQPGYLKCNIDADQNCIGIGLCITNEWSQCVKANSSLHQGCMDYVEAETWALLHALSWIKFQNLSNNVFEIDVQTVMDGINTKAVGKS
ncbi:hypothetical protein GmHk_08G022231 [Glycine max]|nr:hypothetical protein GmHk_08G022231 [Glycine max]